MKYPYFLLLFISWLFPPRANGQAQIRIHTEDLPRFYQAFDSVMTTPDSAKQLRFIQQLYVDKASSGLREFMDLRGGNTREWRRFMVNNPTVLQQKRPQILSVLTQEPDILKHIARFKSYYPNFREGDIYFCVGINNSGGTIRDRTVYIGTEVAANDSPNWSLPLVLHEFVHTQQWTQRHLQALLSDTLAGRQYMDSHRDLLGKCLEEGMADFVAELVLGQPLGSAYLAFGQQHEQAVWTEFETDMNLPFDYKKGWLYAERMIAGQLVRDVGYYVGYQICKRYYARAQDKKRALAYLIELNLTDENARRLLSNSGYSPQKDSQR